MLKRSILFCLQICKATERLSTPNHMGHVSLKFPAQTFLISCLQGSFCLCLSSWSVTSFLSPWGVSKLHKVSPQRPWKIYLFLLLLSLLLIWFPWKITFRRRDSRCQYICQHQLSQPSFNHTSLSQMITNPSKILWEKLLDIYVEAVQENPYSVGCIAHSCA